MRGPVFAVSWIALALPAFSQQIYDIYTTTWDRSSQFMYTNLSPNPINFVTPGAIGQADIVVNDNTVYQTIQGFGGSLTDSSAQLLSNMKSVNPSNYWSLLGYMFDPTDTNEAAGLSYLRVPLGASDFSASSYSYDDTSGDTAFNNFNINKAPSYVFSTIKDIMGINPYLKPGWMKDSGTMDGGNFQNQYITAYANYLLKCLQGFQNNGITLYAIGIQNEPENSNDSYPTAIVTATQEAQIATALRTLMNNNGFSNVKIIGYEHNWDDAGGYPVQIMQQAQNAFAGVAFHCYAGDVTDQDTFHNQFPNKEIYFTECTGSYGSDWWSDIKWYMDKLFIGALEHNAQSALMWNIALDGNGDPELPSSSSCHNPQCRPIVTISGGDYSWNQEFWVMAHAQKAISPKDTNGPFGKRINVTVGGSLNWGLRVGAYVTHRNSASDWLRYSLVVLNWDDSASTTWNPQTVQTTIEFRGMQASYTFPVGITTLWWYAPQTSSSQVQGFNATGIAPGGEQPVGNMTSAPADPVMSKNGTDPPQYTASVSWTQPTPSAASSAVSSANFASATESSSQQVFERAFQPRR